MTEQEQKELAEWAAEWFGWTLLNGWWATPQDEPNWMFEVEYTDHGLTQTFFEPNYMNPEAPILAHLAKRKMEEMGWSWEGIKQCGKPKEYVWHFFKNDAEWSKTAFHENEYIALFFAIREAVKG